MDYYFFVLTVIAVWVILSLATNLVLGYTGLFSIGHVGYMAMGAYTAALLNIFLGVDYYATLPVAMAVTGLMAWLTLLPLMRLGPFHFALATIGLNVVVVDVIHNVAPHVPGSEGLIGLKTPALMSTGPGRFGIAALLTAACLLVAWRVVSSPFGRTLRAIRDRPEAVASIGKDPDRYRVAIWTVSGLMAGAAGWLYGVTLFYIDPTVFVVTFSFVLLVYIGLGGLASIAGSVLGPLVLIAFAEALRFTGLPSNLSGPAQQMLYGLLLMLVMLFRRQGLVGKYEFRE